MKNISKKIDTIVWYKVQKRHWEDIYFAVNQEIRDKVFPHLEGNITNQVKNVIKETIR